MSEILSRRRAALTVLLAAVGAVHGSPAAAEGDKSSVVRIIVPFGPGTPLDVIARDLSQEMRGVLGQNILVDNKPGAAGMIGGAELARTADPATTFMITTHN